MWPCQIGFRSHCWNILKYNTVLVGSNTDLGGRQEVTETFNNMLADWSRSIVMFNSANKNTSPLIFMTTKTYVPLHKTRQCGGIDLQHSKAHFFPVCAAWRQKHLASFQVLHLLQVTWKAMMWTWAAGKCCSSQALKSALSLKLRVVIRLSAYFHEHTTHEKILFWKLLLLGQIHNKGFRTAVNFRAFAVVISATFAP